MCGVLPQTMSDRADSLAKSFESFLRLTLKFPQKFNYSNAVITVGFGFTPIDVDGKRISHFCPSDLNL